MTAKVWSNVAVAVQSALAAGVTITAISKANPGVVSTATTPSAGAFVLITAAGMTEVDQRVFRVANVVASTSFELEGEDTTDYGTFTSGNYQVITFGTSLATVANLSASGGDINWVDVTTIHDKIKKETAGVANSLSYSMENIWDPADAGLIALRNAFSIKGSLAVKFTFADGAIMVGYGAIGATLAPTGSGQDKVTTPTEVRMAGLPTAYAS